jgi:hypothetical protein
MIGEPDPLLEALSALLHTADARAPLAYGDGRLPRAGGSGVRSYATSNTDDLRFPMGLPERDR